MELWIRTQDKMRLVKPNRLAIKRDSRTIGEGDYYIYESQNSLRYGTYTTKERALEVLDEIQDILKPKYILDTSSIKPDGNFYKENGAIFQKYNANAEIKDLSTFVYQMPED